MKRRPARRIAKRADDKAYVEWVHTLPCLMAPFLTCDGPIEAHHAGTGGMGLKAPDTTCVPLCRKHHRNWTDHSGACFGLTKVERRIVSDGWIQDTQAKWEGSDGTSFT